MTRPIDAAEAVAHAQGANMQLCVQTIQNLSNNQLSLHIRHLNGQRRTIDAEFILHLSEFDRRKLFRECACSSLFEFLVSRLGFSEDSAYKRVWGARMLRDYPLAYDLLRNGRIHLSAMLLIRPHLSAENHIDWLMAAAGKSKREVEKLVATRCPKPDSPSRIRQLPAGNPRSWPIPDAPITGTKSHDIKLTSAPIPNAPIPDASIPDAPIPDASIPDASIPDASIPDCPIPGGTISGATSRTIPYAANSNGASPVATEASAPIPDASNSDAPIPDASNSDALAPMAVTTGSTASSSVARSSKIQPLSSHNYRVVFTATEELKQKLSRAGALLSHSIRPNDLPALVERALDVLIQREERRRFGAARTHGKKLSQSRARSIERDAGYIPAAVRREVWQRDGGQCSYDNGLGERCSCKHYLQFDHRVPRALGGTSTIDNIRLRCAEHNALAAEQVFGADRIASAVVSAKARRVTSRAIGDDQIQDH